MIIIMQSFTFKFYFNRRPCMDIKNRMKFRGSVVQIKPEIFHYTTLFTVTYTDVKLYSPFVYVY